MSPEVRAGGFRTRRHLGLLINGLVLLVFVTWFVLLRPQALGGPAAYIMVAGTSMEPTLSGGTLVVMQSAATYGPGDVIAYRIPQGDPAAGINVIHRIVGGSADTGFVMRGDNAGGVDPWRPTPSDIAGRLWLRIPGVGPVLAFLRTPMVVASVAAGIAVYLVLGWSPQPAANPTRRLSDGGRRRA